MTVVEATAIAGVITAAVAAFAALRKLRPERDALVLTTAQGATTILNDLVKTLYAEIDRLRLKETALEEENANLEKALAKAIREARGLRHRYGTRGEDVSGGD